MIVIALLAIFASIAVPSFNTLIANIRTETAASELHSLLISARSNAVTQRVQYSLEQVDGNWQIKQGNTVSGILTLPPSVSVTATPGTVTFKPDGSTGQATTLRLSNSRNSKSYQISVQASGTIRLAPGTS